MLIAKIIGYIVTAILGWIAAQIRAANVSKKESDESNKAIQDAKDNDVTDGLFKP